MEAVLRPSQSACEAGRGRCEFRLFRWGRDAALVTVKWRAQPRPPHLSRLCRCGGGGEGEGSGLKWKDGHITMSLRL